MSDQETFKRFEEMYERDQRFIKSLQRELLLHRKALSVARQLLAGEFKGYRHAIEYAVTALEASSDNGDRYCAHQLRQALTEAPTESLGVPNEVWRSQTRPAQFLTTKRSAATAAKEPPPEEKGTVSGE